VAQAVMVSIITAIMRYLEDILFILCSFNYFVSMMFLKKTRNCLIQIDILLYDNDTVTYE